MARLKTFIRDSQGRVIQYSFKRAPTVERMREIMRQAQKEGAKGVGIVGDVRQFKAYEMPASGHHTVRAYHRTPSGILRTLKDYKGSEPSDYALQHQMSLATHAEQVKGLQGASINFIY